MNHLIYTTFGQQAGSVYATQVIQLLNYWSKREGWKVTLIQIADEPNLGEIEPQVEKIYIKRKFKLLFSLHEKSYVKQIRNRLSIDNKDVIYLNSRDNFAYSIISNYLRTYSINYRCNNLDVRGTIEELKLSKTRRFFYPFFKYRLNRTLKMASSVTTVTTNLKNHLLEYNSFANSDIDIKVVPTLSILEYKFNVNKKDLAYIGKIAWINPDKFVNQILIINDLFAQKNWKISIIGNSTGTLGLENHNIEFIDRMSPTDLNEKISDYHTGLVLRDSSIINKVAAPCKISDYLCLGMPVIFSGEIGSLEDFIHQFPECKKFIVHVDNLTTLGEIDLHINISHKEMETLSIKAQSYFGVESVINQYIKVFNA